MSTASGRLFRWPKSLGASSVICCSILAKILGGIAGIAAAAPAIPAESFASLERPTQVKLDRAKITALQKEHPGALGSARQIARFLCGLNSPSFTQAKLNKHAKFGSLAEVPFQLVLKKAETLTGPGEVASASK